MKVELEENNSANPITRCIDFNKCIWETTLNITYTCRGCDMRTILVRGDGWLCLVFSSLFLTYKNHSQTCKASCIVTRPPETRLMFTLLQLEKVFCKVNMMQLSSIDHALNYFYFHSLSKYILKYIYIYNINKYIE